MQNDIIQKLKDKLQMDLEQCAKDKAELKNQGLFSQSDVLLGRETEIKELQEYIEGLEEATTADISQLYYEEKISRMLDQWLGACEDNEKVIHNIKTWVRCEWASSTMDGSMMINLMARVEELAFKKLTML